MTQQEIQPDLWVLHQLEQTVQFFTAHNVPAYLVGGSLRNLLLGLPCVDWDIVTDQNAPQLARQLAHTLNGFYAPMHEKASRIVLKTAQQEMTIDVSPQHGESIEEDLRARDFTINALAAPLAEIVTVLARGERLTLATPLIDISSGKQDLQARVLRVVTENAFQQDPLRMLRAVRFMTRYDLRIEEHTARLLTRNALLLSRVATERIHDELMMILRPEGALQRLRFLDEHGLLTILIPELEPARGLLQPSLHHWDVFDHSMEAVGMLERLDHALRLPPSELKDSPMDCSGEGDMLAIQQLLQEAEQQGLFSLNDICTVPMKLGALLHDIGKPPTYVRDEEGNITFYHHPQAGIPLAQQITRRLGMNTQDRRLIQQLVAHHMRPGQLSHDPVSTRAVRRYFVDLGPRGINVALVSLADHLAMRGPDPLTVHWQRHLATVRLLLTRYIRERASILPPRLLQADELIHRLHLQPGPLIGLLLESIAEAQAEGRVHSKEEALWLAEEKLQQIQRRS
jgi:tRNA nucleotidyltransferase/poly(A) polymerase